MMMSHNHCHGVPQGASPQNKNGQDTPVPASELRAALMNLQAAVEKSFASGGAVHTPSWRFPAACAAELSMDTLLERYNCDVADPRHSVATRAAVLELVVDRVVLLAESTLSQLDVSEFDETLDKPKGIDVIAALCNSTIRLQDTLSDLETTLENKDSLLDSLDSEIERLNTQSYGGISDSSDTQHHQVTTSAVAAIQTDPIGDCGWCKQCESFRRGVALMRDKIESFNLVDVSALCRPGQNPMLCSKLCLKYLESHAEHLDTLSAHRKRWGQERDDAIEAERKATAALAENQTVVDALRWDLEEQQRKFESILQESKSEAENNLDALSRQFEEETRSLKSRHEESLTELKTKLDTEKDALKHKLEAELSQARAEGSDYGIKIAALTKELLDAAANQRNRDDAHALKEHDSTLAIRQASDKLRGLQIELDSKTKSEALAVSAIGNMKGEVGNLKKQIDDLKARLSCEKKVNEDLEMKLSKVCTENLSHSEELSNRDMTIDKLRHECQSATAEVNSLKEDCFNYQEQLKGMAIQRDEAENWLDKASTERQKLLARIAQLEPWAPAECQDSTKTDGIRKEHSTSSALENEGIVQQKHESHAPMAAAPTPPPGRKTMTAKTRASVAVPIERSQNGSPFGSPKMDKNSRQAAIRRYLAARAASTD